MKNPFPPGTPAWVAYDLWQNHGEVGGLGRRMAAGFGVRTPPAAPGRRPGGLRGLTSTPPAAGRGSAPPRQRPIQPLPRRPNLGVTPPPPPRYPNAMRDAQESLSWPHATPVTPEQRARFQQMLARGEVRFAPGLTIAQVAANPRAAINPENYLVSSDLNRLTYDPQRRARMTPQQAARERWVKMVAQLPEPQRSRVQAIREYWRDPRVLAYLDTIAYAERTRYNSMIGDNVPGMQTFADFSRHPGRVGADLGSGPGSAAGRYQLLEGTFNDKARQLGPTDISPLTQDAMGVQRMVDRHALAPLLADNFVDAASAASREWASIPDPATGRSRYNVHGKPQRSVPMPELEATYQEKLARYRRLMGGN